MTDARTPGIGRALLGYAAGLAAATAAVSLAATTVVAMRAACASGGGGRVRLEDGEEWHIHLARLSISASAIVAAVAGCLPGRDEDDEEATT